MYTGLKLGTIDCMTYTVVELQSANFKEVVKYIEPTPVGLGVNILYINMNAWNSLGPDLQKQVQTYADTNIPVLDEQLHQVELQSLDAAKQYGVKFVNWSDADMARFHAGQQAYWDTFASKSPLAADMVQTIRNFMKSKGR